MENVENIILEHLRAMRGDMTAIKDDMRELKGCMANLEADQATLMQQMEASSLGQCITTR